MKEFIELNRVKMFSCIKWTSIIFTSLVLIAFLFSIYNGQTPALNLIIIVLLFAGVFFPLFITILSVIKDGLTYIKTKAVFNSSPINELQQIDLKQAYKFENSKWLYTQLMLKGKIENYPIECELEYSLLKITIPVVSERLENRHMEKLKLMFGMNNIKYDLLGVSLLFNSKRRKDLTYKGLETEINQLIDFFKREKIEP